MRMLVEFDSLPRRTGWPFSSTAKPPGPGFGSALPSVHKIFDMI